MYVPVKCEDEAAHSAREEVNGRRESGAKSVRFNGVVEVAIIFMFCEIRVLIIHSSGPGAFAE